MRTLLALIAVVSITWLVGSAALRTAVSEVEEPGILKMRVLNGHLAEAELPKFSSPLPVYLVKGDSAEVLLRVEEVDKVDASLTINARTSFGSFSGRRLGESYVLLNVELPAPGSLWEVPGPGVTSPPELMSLGREQPFLLQISGWAGSYSPGERPEAGASLFIVRQE